VKPEGNDRGTGFCGANRAPLHRGHEGTVPRPRRGPALFWAMLQNPLRPTARARAPGNVYLERQSHETRMASNSDRFQQFGKTLLEVKAGGIHRNVGLSIHRFASSQDALKIPHRFL